MSIWIILVIFAIFLAGNEAQRRWRKSGALNAKRGPDKQFRNSKLVSVLLGLEDNSVTELLRLYKEEFGKGAAKYAKKTYQKWKSGEVQPTVQTYDRFLVHLPKVMGYDLKCEVLRHFMEEYSAKDRYQLDVFTDDWEEKLVPLVKQMVDKAYTAQLPVEVERKLKWLGEGDMQAAQTILRESQAEEGKIAVALLREEFASFEMLLAEDDLNPKIRHTIKFPYGTIELKIRNRR